MAHPVRYTVIITVYHDTLGDSLGLRTVFKILYLITISILEDVVGYENGRGGRIWTDDHHTPSVVRYQTALHPD